MKNKFNLFGGGFQHAKSSTLYKESDYITWDYNSRSNDISFFIDDAIIYGFQENISKINFGWILESKYITPQINDICLKNLNLLKTKFKNIFTHNQELISLDNDFFKFLPANGTWIDDIGIRKKNKLASMIASNKNFTNGHRIRLNIAKTYADQIDLFGRGFNEIQKKEQGLEDYMFSIVVENGLYKSYFTEKILDCFAVGTIPIYLGTPDIYNFFDMDGIIILDNLFDIKNLTPDLYYSKLNAISKNCEIVKNFNVAEDWLYKNYFMD